MATKSTSEPNLKTEVENQCARLRALAHEIELYADNAGFTSRGGVPFMRDWSATLRSLADELTDAVNGAEPEESVLRLSRFGKAVVAALLVFAPTINDITTDAIHEYVLPDRAVEISGEIEDGFMAIELHAASRAETPSVSPRRITLGVSDSVQAQLDTESEKLGISKADYVRRALSLQRTISNYEEDGRLTIINPETGQETVITVVD